MRERVVSRGRTGYLALYDYDEVRDVAVVLAIRHQREAGYTSRLTRHTAALQRAASIETPSAVYNSGANQRAAASSASPVRPAQSAS